MLPGGFLAYAKHQYSQNREFVSKQNFVSLLTSNIMLRKPTNTQALRELNAFESFAYEAEDGAFFL